MANNLWNGINILMDQVERSLQDEKKNGNIHIEYSKIKSFARALNEVAGGKGQIAKYEAEDLIEKACRECNISSKDTEEIENILMGVSGR